ncbi:MAG: ComEC/Rec2 family competence protein [Rickettsiaceae bacterium]|nr:ComEC/Rec2 family competence protein [Rickettsiaceae bacterium]
MSQNSNFSDSNFLDQEVNNLSFWYIISFLFGILYFFYFLQDLNYNFAKDRLFYFAIIVSIVLLYIIWRIGFNTFNLFSFILRLALFFLIGYLCISLRCNANFESLDHDLKNCLIEGKIIKIKPTPFGAQVTLQNVKLHSSFDMSNIKCTYKILPFNVRVNLNRKYSKNLLHGDVIALKVDLLCLPEEIVPGGYNFRKIAFFSNIGAIAKAKSYPKVITKQVSFYSIQTIRKKIFNYLLENLGYKNGNFAAALFLGEAGGIDKTILNNMRYAGISHILCVSGLHLSLVASLVFFSSRIFLNCFDYINFNFDIKKISAFISIFVSFLYLILTGVQIAASRAFIMVFFVMMTIILDRHSHPLRSISLACFAMLLINPEYAILPSFQLSFIAVLSLLAGYEYYSKFITSRKGSIFYNIKIYLYSNIYSSLIASSATSPLVMYHFYIYSNYSLAANLVAVPLTSFVIMPCAVLAILLYPIYLDFIPTYFISLSIDIINYAASVTTNLPFSVIYTGYVSNIAILSFILGFFWLCLFRSNIRFYGIIGPIIFIIIFYTGQGPDILINKRANFVAEKRSGKVIIYSEYLSPFAKNFIANWFGCRESIFVKKNMKQPLNLFYETTDQNIEINLDKSLVKIHNSPYEPIADMSVIYFANQNKPIIEKIK